MGSSSFIFLEKGMEMKRISGKQLCEIIHEYGLDDAELDADNGTLYHVNIEDDTVTAIHLFIQKQAVWPCIDKWPDNFDDLSYEEQQDIIDKYDVLLYSSICEPFKQIDKIPLSMYRYYCGYLD